MTCSCTKLLSPHLNTELPVACILPTSDPGWRNEANTTSRHNLSLFVGRSTGFLLSSESVLHYFSSAGRGSAPANASQSQRGPEAIISTAEIASHSPKFAGTEHTAGQHDLPPTPDDVVQPPPITSGHIRQILVPTCHVAHDLSGHARL